MKLCKGREKGRRTLSIICAVVLVLAQLVLVVPAIQETFAQSGGDLEIRVKYFGEQENKIRTKHIFTAGELMSMDVQQWCYSNVTKVGTVMVMKARGPQVLEVIERAGIDLNSVQRINFRAGDNYGYTRDFTVAHHLSGGRYYYPNLNSNYIRGEDQATLTPGEGALDGACEVPAILALEFGASKAAGKTAESLSLGTSEVYRFCLGQTPLQEGVSTGGDKDVTSAESIHTIHGIDVTLYGSPVSDIMMDLTDTNLKVGSKKKINISFSGDELFKDDLAAFAGKLKWKSSNPSVVKVDQNGNITVLKKGRATITVTAANGMSASVTINATGKAKESDSNKDNTKAGTKSGKTGSKSQNGTGEKTGQKASTRSDSNKAAISGSSATATATEPVKKARVVVVKEIQIGEEITPEAVMQEQMREQMADDARAMGKIKQFGKGVAAGTGAGLALFGGAGAFFRVRRFRRDMGLW